MSLLFPKKVHRKEIQPSLWPKISFTILVLILGVEIFLPLAERNTHQSFHSGLFRTAVAEELTDPVLRQVFFADNRMGQANELIEALHKPVSVVHIADRNETIVLSERGSLLFFDGSADVGWSFKYDISPAFGEQQRRQIVSLPSAGCIYVSNFGTSTEKGSIRALMPSEYKWQPTDTETHINNVFRMAVSSDSLTLAAISPSESSLSLFTVSANCQLKNQTRFQYEYAEGKFLPLHFLWGACALDFIGSDILCVAGKKSGAMGCFERSIHNDWRLVAHEGFDYNAFDYNAIGNYVNDSFKKPKSLVFSGKGLLYVVFDDPKKLVAFSRNQSETGDVVTKDPSFFQWWVASVFTGEATSIIPFGNPEDITLIENGTVALLSDTNGVYALDLLNHEMHFLWHLEKGRGELAYGDGSLFVTDTEASTFSIYSLQSESGGAAIKTSLLLLVVCVFAAI